MGVINAVAQFERDLLIERTQSGLKRAKAEARCSGARQRWTFDQRDAVRAGLAAGVSVSELPKRHSTSRQTIMRVRDAAPLDENCTPARRQAASGSSDVPVEVIHGRPGTVAIAIWVGAYMVGRRDGRKMPKAVAMILLAAAAISASARRADWLYPSAPQTINVHLDAPIVVQPR